MYLGIIKEEKDLSDIVYQNLKVDICMVSKPLVRVTRCWHRVEDDQENVY